MSYRYFINYFYFLNHVFRLFTPDVCIPNHVFRLFTPDVCIPNAAFHPFLLVFHVLNLDSKLVSAV